MASTTKYRFKTKPYAHQRAALKKLIANRWGGALLMEPRTGKTKVAIDWLGCLATKGRIDRAVVVCPATVMAVWANEVAVHSPLRVEVTLWDSEARKHGVPKITPGYDLHILVVNYDAFSQAPKRTKSGRYSSASGRLKHKRQVQKWLDGKPAALVLDESHKVKSPGSSSTRTIKAMSGWFDYRVILTGTPQTKHNQPKNIWSQWNILHPESLGGMTADDWEQHYGEFRWRSGFRKLCGMKNLDELQEFLERDSVIVKREDCFDLPPREDIRVSIELGKATRQAYVDIAERMITQLKEAKTTATADLAVVQALRLSQITSGFITDDEGEVQQLGLEKIKAVEALLTDLCCEQKLPVVVMARWRQDIANVKAVAESLELPVGEVSGRVSREDSARDIERFQNGDGPAVIVCQPAAASLGINLARASHMIWVSHTPVWTDYSQACDRIALSKTSTTQWHLVVPGSVDEILLDTLSADGDTSNALLTRPDDLLKNF